MQDPRATSDGTLPNAAIAEWRFKMSESVAVTDMDIQTDIPATLSFWDNAQTKQKVCKLHSFSDYKKPWFKQFPKTNGEKGSATTLSPCLGSGEGLSVESIVDLSKGFKNDGTLVSFSQHPTTTDAVTPTENCLTFTLQPTGKSNTVITLKDLKDLQKGFTNTAGYRKKQSIWDNCKSTRLAAIRLQGAQTARSVFVSDHRCCSVPLEGYDLIFCNRGLTIAELLSGPWFDTNATQGQRVSTARKRSNRHRR
ncbi:hypothetical protein BD324DRAFT_367532 [Kockovaella imperatae]|uniref:Uncharacterized protein n=1 Tax=Kockovaella imperatae TaxID=4999 RepID=A0A1Y1UKJ5_9TREE|nr:hypothetical protein BD324DRAFT_367532 [Kockovaella imperatae]ORX38573.1 hypothetical protein BD324DRAFT_367532 [Kockovaella imperatae]